MGRQKTPKELSLNRNPTHRERRRSRTSPWLTRRFAAVLASLAGIAIAHLWLVPHLSLEPLFAVPVGWAALRLSRPRAWATAVLAALLWQVTDSAAIAAGDSVTFLTNLAIRMAVLLGAVEAILALRIQARKESLRADTDFATGALNKRGFQRRAALALLEARERKLPVGLALLDVDDFKRINDTYGHHKGDSVLRWTATVLRQGVRPGDVVGRLGGDEFAILFPGARSAEMEAVVRRLNAHLRNVLRDKVCVVTFSVGAVSFPKAPRTLSELMLRADRLMYATKASGKNGVRFAVASSRDASRRHAFTA